jgi:metallo-beta-lactamase family protein
MDPQASGDRGSPVTLSFLGAVGTVTGSSFLVRHGADSILVDCGLYQGDRTWRQRNWDRLPYDASALSGVVLTHAHLDHCGGLPRLTRSGYRGPVWCTEGTRQLAPLVLRDSAHLQERYAEAARAGGFSRHLPPAPLYRGHDVEDVVRLLRGIDYGRPQVVAQDTTVTFTRAGHILGAASALLTVGDETILFSGDLGRSDHPILLPREAPPAARTVVLEATYGNRTHARPATPHEELARTIRETVRRGGSILIPAFALDRTELVLRALSELTRSGAIPRVPAHVDSPMALAAWDIYREQTMRSELRGELSASIADELDLRLARTAEESIQLNYPREPSIVVSASGMASGGRVVHHLMSMLPEAYNSVVLTGYQASGTPGRLLADGEAAIKLYGRYVPVRANVVVDEEFSVHADADELVTWLQDLPSPPDTVYLVHGEDESRRSLAERIRERTGWLVVTPTLHETVRVDRALA